jgi:3-hydroxyisobutyrate dehydrogenase
MRRNIRPKRSIASGVTTARIAPAAGTLAGLMSTIAWLGAGLLGAGFVEAALARGASVRVYNRTFAKLAPLAARGAVPCERPADAVAGASRVHVCVSDDSAVDGVLAEVLPALGPGVPVIDHSTGSPDGARARAARLRERGVGYLSCPVFMGPVNARQASGRMLCAGPADLSTAMEPHLRAMTGELLACGEDHGVACALKLVGNNMILGVAACLADAFAIGRGAGLSAEEVLRFAGAFPFANIVSGRGARMIAGDYAASFELAMARKDVRLMMASSAELPLAVLPGLAARMDALIARGHGSDDVGVLSVDTLPPQKG